MHPRRISEDIEQVSCRRRRPARTKGRGQNSAGADGGEGSARRQPEGGEGTAPMVVAAPTRSHGRRGGDDSGGASADLRRLAASGELAKESSVAQLRRCQTGVPPTLVVCVFGPTNIFGPKFFGGEGSLNQILG